MREESRAPALQKLAETTRQNKLQGGSTGALGALLLAARVVAWRSPIPQLSPLEAQKLKAQAQQGLAIRNFLKYKE